MWISCFLLPGKAGECGSAVSFYLAELVSVDQLFPLTRQSWRVWIGCFLLPGKAGECWSAVSFYPAKLESVDQLFPFKGYFSLVCLQFHWLSFLSLIILTSLCYTVVPTLLKMALGIFSLHFFALCDEAASFLKVIWLRGHANFGISSKSYMLVYRGLRNSWLSIKKGS